MLQGAPIRRGEEVTLVSTARLRPSFLLALPVATAIALAVHFFVSQSEPALEAHSYTLFLWLIFGAGVALTIIQLWWPALRRWMRAMCPILAVAILLLCVWEIITSGLRLLPLPYFPSPAGVLQSLLSDRVLLFDSTWHSLILLLGGYTLGVIAGLISGICIGWSSPARYWGMPVLKIVGPIPATAWIPLAMVVSPSAVFSAAALIALAVWFPVTMLTASGISNTRASYLDVARTLGAGRGLSHFSRRHSGGAAEHFHRAVHGTGRIVLDAGRRRNRGREIRSRLVCELGAGLG